MLYKSPLFRTLLLIVSVTLTGVLGFYLSEPHYTWFDALYMTVITISTVGYTEVGELSSQGKVFAIFFIIVGLLVFAFALRLIAEHLLGVWTSNTWKLKKNKDKDRKMVQVNISARAISAIDSSLIAAKSDFATVENEYELSAELEAFDVTSQKLADFLLPSFHRYWEKGVQVPAEKAPDAPPMSMTDM